MVDPGSNVWSLKKFPGSVAPPLRSIRGVAVGRRNWTFFRSDNGGHTAAVLSSLVATAKWHHIDPFAYLRDVFARISAHPQSRIEKLLPNRWAAAQPRV